MAHIFSIQDAHGYGIIDAADTRGYKNAYIDYVQKLALDREGVFKPGDVVLDFGCGVGRWCAWLASRCRRVYGIDVSRELLRLASAHNARTNVVYQAYDGVTMPFAPASFDAILCVGVLQKRVLPEGQLSPMLGEFRRVLQTPGTVVAIEHVSGRAHAWRYQREELLAQFAHHGFVCTACYPLRKGHWPVLYLIRYGLIPPRLFARLAQYELDKRRHESEAYFDYKDYLFRFERKG